MTNILIKDTTIAVATGTEYIPAIPGAPATPARTVYESRNICGFRYTGPGHYTFTTDPSTLAVTMVWVPDTPGETGIWACDTETVPVNYPATPARPFVPGYTVGTSALAPSFNLGWNSGARSIAFFTDVGYVTFQVNAATVGVIAGLNYSDGLPEVYNGNAIDFAFQCMHGVARIIENGAVIRSVGAYTDSTVFRIECSGYGGAVTYLMNGTAVYVSTTPPPSAPAWLEAALYSGTDRVNSPTLVQGGVNGHATLGGSLVPLTIFAARTGYAQMDGVTTRLVTSMTAGPHASISASLAPLTIFASRAGYAEMDGLLTALTDELDAGLSVPSFAIMDAGLPPLAVYIDSLTGERGAISAPLVPLVTLMADHPYGAMAATLWPVNGALSALEGNFAASISARGAASAKMVAATFVVVTMRSAGAMSSLLLRGLLFDATIMAQAALGSTFALHSVLQAVMRSAAQSTTSLGNDGGDTQTWVVNMDGFGSTTYSNFTFNSFAQIGGVYYGANSDGVYALDGDTDDGALIRSSVSLGKLDFGRTEQKTVIACYVGMSGAGNLFVKAITDMGTYIYTTRSFSPDMKQQRVDFGKGLKTNYVGLEIYNENGADFELNTVEFHVVDLARRI